MIPNNKAVSITDIDLREWWKWFDAVGKDEIELVAKTVAIGNSSRWQRQEGVDLWLTETTDSNS